MLEKATSCPDDVKELLSLWELCHFNEWLLHISAGSTHYTNSEE